MRSSAPIGSARWDSVKVRVVVGGAIRWERVEALMYALDNVLAALDEVLVKVVMRTAAVAVVGMCGG